MKMEKIENDNDKMKKKAACVIGLGGYGETQ